MRTVIVGKDRVIPLGRQGENGVTEVRWQGIISEWEALYGAGTFSIALQRKGDENPYPLVFTIEEDDIVWVVSNADTAKVGDVRCELTYFVDDAIAKSQVWACPVCPSLTGEELEDPPEPYQNWIDNMTGTLTRVSEAIPEGGLRGQVLAKKSDSSYDTEWVTVQGGGGGGGASTTYVFTQAVAADTWEIAHGLGKFPSVSVVDSGGNCVVGDVTYVSSDMVRCSFAAAFSGTAYLN